MRPLAHRAVTGIGTSRRAALAAATLALAFAADSKAQAPSAPPETEHKYLSGADVDSPILWQFRVDEGLRSGEWAEIPVPAHWEQHGFGRYAYGHDEHESDEVGSYRTAFSVPESWRERRVRLRFDGVMTDTTPTLNGTRLATHQGGFTPFSYDVTRLLRFGGDNQLDVRVAERSANATINAAEREADYWVFGGIYRPVYLEAVPRAAIEDVAIDARHDGALTVAIATRTAPEGSRLRVRVLDEQGVALQPDDEVALGATVVPGAKARLRASFAEALPWSAETPRLYRLEATLEDARAAPLHVVTQRFGFRTIEVRLGSTGDTGETPVQPGLFVNDRRVLLRGVNRHAFWPDTGRAGSPRRNREDVERIRGLHLNAVRASHYPPDRDFLDACDELGLYVVDELPGWHDAYDANAGAAILREMLRRDRNHPSVLVWANGNEGGWNSRLDQRFAAYDPQRRPVIHPDADFGGFDTGHYPSFEELRARLADSPPRSAASLVMPTEWLHGLYDGGGGAGLGAYWEALRASPRGAGGFLWSFADEAIARSDRGGVLDHHGDLAPDGILGPWREETGSSAAVREVFSPVRLLAVERADAASRSPSGVLTPADRLTGRRRLRLLIENRADPLALEGVRLGWRRVRYGGPFAEAAPLVLDGGFLFVPRVELGDTAWLTLEPLAAVPPPRKDPRDPLALDALEVVVTRRDTTSRVAGAEQELGRWSLPFDDSALPDTSQKDAAGEERAASSRDGSLELRGGGTIARFDAGTGSLEAIERDGVPLPLRGGATAVGASASAPPEVVVRGRESSAPRAPLELVVRSAGPLREASWRIDDAGWLRLRYRLEDDGSAAAAGIAFTGLPWQEIESVEWVGGGPYRVWGNRLEGAALGRWSFDPRRAVDPPWIDPSEGARSGVRWARIELALGTWIVAPALAAGDAASAEPEDPPVLGAPFLWLSRPTFPDDARGAQAELSSGLDSADSFAVLHRIAPIGTKFHAARSFVRPGGAVTKTLAGEIAMIWIPRSPASARDTPD